MPPSEPTDSNISERDYQRGELMTATVQPVRLAVHGADWTYVNELRRRRFAAVCKAGGPQAVPRETAAESSEKPATWQDWYPIIAGAVPEGTDPTVIQNIAVTVSMQKYHHLIEELARTLEA
jgi:hypothetical protein